MTGIEIHFSGFWKTSMCVHMMNMKKNMAVRQESDIISLVFAAFLSYQEFS
jgi:hypothetical protein